VRAAVAVCTSGALVMTDMVVVSCGLWPSGASGVVPAHRFRGPPNIGLDTRPGALPREVSAGDRVASPTPGVGKGPSPGPPWEGHTADMTSLAAPRRRSRREWLAAALVLAGLAGFVLLVYVVVVLGGGVL